jgi:hypothetical protein
MAPPPLLVAAKAGDLQEVKRLLASGEQVDSHETTEYVEERWYDTKEWTHHGPSPLIAALVAGHAAVVKALLEAGADTKFRSDSPPETPEKAALAFKEEYPEAASFLLNALCEECRGAAVAAWQAYVASPMATLFERCAGVLFVGTALQSLQAEPPADARYDLSGLLCATQAAALEAVPESMRAQLLSAWKAVRERAVVAQGASKACLRYSQVLTGGEWVAADPGAAAFWTERSVRAASLDSMEILGLASTCGSTPPPHAPPLLHELHEARTKAEARQREERAAEDARVMAASRARAREAALRFERHRAREVERCRQFDGLRRGMGGACMNYKCGSQDFCTYLHDDGEDIPPHCRWYAQGKCTNGPRCWFNHLRRVPPSDEDSSEEEKVESVKDEGDDKEGVKEDDGEDEGDVSEEDEDYEDYMSPSSSPAVDSGEDWDAEDPDAVP